MDCDRKQLRVPAVFQGRIASPFGENDCHALNWRGMQESGANLRSCPINAALMRRCITAVVACLACFALSACHDRRSAAERRATEPVLLANPNPVPAGDLDQPLGSTRITWNTGSQAIGDLYVKVNRSPDVFLARSPSGTFDANWIQFDSLYEFRLYTKKRSRLLARVQVTRDD